MKELAGQFVIHKELFMTLWLQRLPNNMQAILTVSADQDMAKLVEIADKLADVYSNSEVCHVKEGFPSPSRSTKINKIKKEHIEINYYRRTRSPPRNKYQTKKVYKLFWYHYKFGKLSKKCIAPCE